MGRGGELTDRDVEFGIWDLGIRIWGNATRECFDDGRGALSEDALCAVAAQSVSRAA
jgi:hypothetical protein